MNLMENTCKHLALTLVLLLCLIMASLAKKTPNLTTDQSALLSLKAHITSDPFQFLSYNWTVASSVCDWIGVTCGSRHKRVTALNISNMGLIGTIPSQLGNLSFLVSLDLSQNSFHGSLPHELAYFRRLKFMNFWSNGLNGAISTWIGSLSQLRYLLMANNNFSGLIPPSVSNLSKLEMLFLSSNSLEGTVPAEIGNLYHLKDLAIERNYLSGSLPLEMFNISTLETIAFSENTLSGDLPNHMCGHLARLEWLNLGRNEYSGDILFNLSQCTKLKHLDFSFNNFSAAYIPKEIGNLHSLEFLGLQRNNLKGGIPWELGYLYNLEILSLGYNNLGGQIPKGIYNLSLITIFSFADNSLLGHLPSDIGSALPNLEELYLNNNNLYGVIPHSISNSSKLQNLELAHNNFTGSIPESLGDLNLLETLNLRGNQLRSKISSQDLDFFTFLSKCKKLRWLRLADNPLDGFLPVTIGNLSKSIEMLTASNCKIKGSIPGGLGSLTKLYRLVLSSNQLSGSVPSSIYGIQDLQVLNLSYNMLSGFVPRNLCGMQKLSELYIEGNQIFGPLPNCLGNITSLRILSLGSNRLTSRIPTSLWNLKDILKLNFSSNYFGGSLPLEVGNLKAAIEIDFSRNSFSEDLPSTIGDLQQLGYLHLAMNNLQGSIPESIGKMLSLKYLDLSHNEFSNSIPRSLENLRDLKYFNVSFNKLRGEIPSRGPFQNFTSQSFIFNDALCGAPKFNVSPCPKMRKTKAMHHHMFLLLVILAPALVVVTLALVYIRYVKKQKLVPNGIDSGSVATPRRISYHELLRATHGYDESNLIGTGSFGTVYKGILNDGKVVAIKVFNLQEERAFKSFEEECEALCNIRHRNLTKVISSCSRPDFKALILEFMSNGSLEKWLYSHNYYLDIMQRLNIMIDVACALQYLHFGNSTQIVHCDLKPSNILLDQDMVAHISDFGISKLLGQEQSKTYTQTLPTLGYIAPEYGLEGLVSTKCDVYSYGILLMEIFTRKRPSDEMFNEGLSLRDWVNISTSDAFAQVIDANLLKDGEEYSNGKLKCLSSIFEVSLNCSMESPSSRPNMEEVLVALEKIRHQFLQYQGKT